MFDRPQSGERAVLLHVHAAGLHDDEDVQEFCELARSAGARNVANVEVTLRAPHPRTLIGRGKLAEVAALVAAHNAELVIVDHALSPAQERNLERELNCRVVDRIGLILDIFAARASTFEGKLQVELAQLRHLSTRLVRGWTHLERQKGGIGLRGPGETQLESDRRLVHERIQRITKRLRGVSRRRALSRRARARAQAPVVSLVGYTNAGKSSLFNALTGSQLLAEDKLFATLDPTLRRLELDSDAAPVIVADTVGFIRDLPPELVAAFRATLEETRASALLLHVVDISSGDPLRKKVEVNEVLERIGAGQLPQIEIYNKIDRLAPPISARVDRDVNGAAARVWASAKSGDGLDLIRRTVSQQLAQERVCYTVCLAPGDGRNRARVFSVARVTEERVAEDGAMELDVVMSSQQANRLRKHDGLSVRQMASDHEAPCTAA